MIESSQMMTLNRDQTMTKTTSRYQHVTCRKTEGAHYTPEHLSQFVSKKIIDKMTSHKNIIIADPAIGDGELILSFLSTLGSQDGIHIIGFDINEKSIEISRNRILDFFPNVELTLIHGDFLDYCIHNDSLFNKFNLPKFDAIISNPPYIRTQTLGSEQSQYLAKHFNLKGRVDIYQAFLIAMSKCLSPDGVAGVIVSNRFLTTKGAMILRESLYNLYDIHNIWDFGDTKLFEAAVLPAVLLFSLKKNKNKDTVFQSIYETTEPCTYQVDNAVSAIEQEGIVRCDNGKSYIVKKGNLSFDDSPTNPWRIKDELSDKWLTHVNQNTWKTFGEIGKIRVGVKTTADNVFIRESRKNENQQTIELAKPLITHHVARRFKQSPQKTKYILYTHEVINGKRKAIDINQFPISKSYLEKHKDQLEGRNYVIKANRNWYEIWVPQNPSLWLEDKIVFRDICEEPTFWIDKQQSIVNGDCYWMVNDFQKDNDNILWLILAVANSTFIEYFYDIKFNNKLYSNKRRFISQYVEQFPLPHPETETALKMISLAKKIYTTKDSHDTSTLEAQLNSLVWEAFKLPNNRN